MREAEDGHVERIGDEGTDHAGDQRVGFEVFAIEHLDAGDRRTQGRAEDRAQAPGGPGQQQDTPLCGRELEPGADPRAQARADLHQRPLLTRSATGRERDDGRQRFDRSDDGPDLAALVVEGVDHRVCARALGLGREAMGQPAAHQAAECGQQQQQPEILFARGRAEKGKVEANRAGGADGAEASEFFDQQEAGQFEAIGEDDRTQARDEADQDAVEVDAADKLKAEPVAEEAGQRAPVHRSFRHGRWVPRRHPPAATGAESRRREPRWQRRH